MSFEPEQIAAEIRKHIPDFKMDYQIDPVKQAIANSWPNSMDDTCAREEEWGWAPKYDLTSMTNDMLIKVKEKIRQRIDQIKLHIKEPLSTKWLFFDKLTTVSFYCFSNFPFREPDSRNTSLHPRPTSPRGR